MREPGNIFFFVMSSIELIYGKFMNKAGKSQ